MEVDGGAVAGQVVDDSDVDSVSPVCCDGRAGELAIYEHGFDLGPSISPNPVVNFGQGKGVLGPVSGIPAREDSWIRPTVLVTPVLGVETS